MLLGDPRASAAQGALMLRNALTPGSSMHAVHQNANLALKAQITLMRTSPGPGGSTFTVVTCRGFFASHATAALHSMACTYSCLSALLWLWRQGRWPVKANPVVLPVSSEMYVIQGPKQGVHLACGVRHA